VSEKPGAVHPEDDLALQRAAARLRSAISGSYETSAGTVTLGCSAGTASWEPGQNAEAVLSAADLAMFADKARRSTRAV